MNDIDSLREAISHEMDGLQPLPPTPAFLKQARRRRAAHVVGAALLSVAVVAAIVLPLKALWPLADRYEDNPAGPPAAVDASHWPPAPPITPEMLDLPKDWDGLTGHALADHLGLLETTRQDCTGPAWMKTQGDLGWCVAAAVPLTHAQTAALLALLHGDALADPSTQTSLATGMTEDAKAAGDSARVADLNWLYSVRPRLLDTSDGGPIVTPPNAIVPARPGQDTYVFSNIEFTYPYVPGGVTGATPDPGFATLRLDSNWSGDTFPGSAYCQVRFLAADGSDVGGLTGGWTQMTRHVTFGYGTKPDDEWLGIFPVTGVPVSTRAECSAGTKPPSGVTLDDLRLQRQGNGLAVAAVYRVPGQPSRDNSGPQVCEIRATSVGGQALSQTPGSIDAPDGEVVHISVPDTWEGATDLTAECHPFTGTPAG